MRMSSPARSSASPTIGGQGGGGGNAGISDDAASCHFLPDIMSAYDRKEEALAALRSELMAALQKEVKSLDDDAWKFAGPRSQIHRISKPGGYQQKQTGSAGEMSQLTKQTRSVLR